MRLRTALFSLLLVVFAAACADETTYNDATSGDETTTGAPLESTEASNPHLFGDADADGSGWLDDQEFRNDFTQAGHYSRWDADGDAALTQDEFSSGLYNQYDANRDGRLDENEYGQLETNYLSNHPGHTNDRAFADYDTDASGDLSQDEFGAGFSETDYFGAWDTDTSGDLNEDEFGTGLFGIYDQNANQQFDETEYNSYERDWATLDS